MRGKNIKQFWPRFAMKARWFHTGNKTELKMKPNGPNDQHTMSVPVTTQMIYNVKLVICHIHLLFNILKCKCEFKNRVSKSCKTVGVGKINVIK